MGVVGGGLRWTEMVADLGGGAVVGTSMTKVMYVLGEWMLAKIYS